MSGLDAAEGDPDSRLVARARDGDEDAFADLFRGHSDRVFRLALSILGRGFEAEAEDVAQEVFVRVHNSLGSFRGDAKVSSWIYRITFNQALNVKARARHIRPHLDESALSRHRHDGARAARPCSKPPSAIARYRSAYRGCPRSTSRPSICITGWARVWGRWRPCSMSRRTRSSRTSTARASFSTGC